MSAANTDWDNVKAQAAEWVFRTQGTLSKSQLEAFDAWRRADQRHDYAFKAASEAYSDLADLAQIPEVNTLFSPPTWRERTFEALRRFPPLHWLAVRPQRRMATGFVAVAALLLAISPPLRSPAYETQVAEMRAVTLPDGSIVALGSNSRLETHFTRNERRVALKRGDAFFAVTKNAARPFYVDAGDAVVRVVGTKFDVARGSADVRVAVVEGTVEVAEPTSSTSPKRSDPQFITAGQQLTAARNNGQMEFRVSQLSPPAARASLRLDYSDAKLSDVVADANRYYTPGIELAGTVGDLRVTMSFRSTQVEATMKNLMGILPVNVAENPDGRLVISPQN